MVRIHEAQVGEYDPVMICEQFGLGIKICKAYLLRLMKVAHVASVWVRARALFPPS
jgi:hypothetical protein